MNNKIYLKKILSLALLPIVFCGTPLAGENAKISVSHQRGTVEVPLNPKRAVVMDYGSLDTIDALNPDLELAVPKRNMPKYLGKFRSDKYSNVGSVKEFDLEAINVFKPDLIVISSRQQDYYRELSKIAPVYCVDTLAKDQLAEARKNAEFFGRIFNKEKEVAAFLKDIDESVARVNKKAKLSGLKALVLLANDGKISAYGSGSRFGIIHDGLGVLQADSKIKVGVHGQLVNYEYVSITNPDVIFVIDRSAVIGTRAKGTRLLNNPLVGKTSAAKNNRIIMLDPEYWYLSGGGLQSMSNMIAEIENAMTKK